MSFDISTRLDGVGVDGRISWFVGKTGIGASRPPV